MSETFYQIVCGLWIAEKVTRLIKYWERKANILRERTLRMDDYNSLQIKVYKADADKVWKVWFLGKISYKQLIKHDYEDSLKN